MLLFCDSFSHYSTSQINDKYPPVAFDPISSVTIVPGAGRLGGGAAYFDTTLGDMNRIGRLTPTADPTITVGLAYRTDVLPGPGGHTILTISLNHPLAPPDITVHLQAHPTPGGDGTTFSVSASYGTVSDWPGLSLTSPLDKMLPLGATGYLELQICLTPDGISNGFATLRITGFAVDYCSFPARTGTWASIQLGGQTPFSIGTELGSWYICDLYVTDGVAPNPSFLGDVHIVALFPTADGYNLDIDNTPWVTSAEALYSNPSAAHYLQLNAPVAPDTGGREMGYTAGNLSSFLFTHPQAGTYLPNGDLWGYTTGVPWELIALQWVARVRSLSAATPAISPVIREISGGTIPTDNTLIDAPDVPLPPGTLPGFTQYAFACVPYDYNPLYGAPWQVPALLLQLVPGVPNTVEMGIYKVPGVA